MKTRPSPAWRPCRLLQCAPVSCGALLGTLALLAVAAPLRAQTSVIAVSCPSGPVELGTVVESAVSIDVGSAALGAYTVDVVFDSAVIVIGSIDGGATPEFSSPPQTNPDSFGTGVTRVSAFQSSSLESPTGTVDVMRITFTVVGAGGSCGALEVVPHVLADTDGRELLAEPTSCPVTVGGIASLAAADASACTGDCNGDHEVTIVELLRGVNIALGAQGICRCLGFDDNSDGAVTINELVGAVLYGLDGCPNS